MTSNDTISCIVYPTSTPVPEWLWRPDQIGYPILPGPGERWATQDAGTCRPTNATTEKPKAPYKVERADDNTLLVFVKMPGFKKDEISVYIDKKYLYVMASSKDEFIGVDFEEEIKIPESTVTKAEFKDGLLVVSLELTNKKKEVLIS